ncbi:MAG TPA: sulfotransferase [Gaiellaceae bacterium]|nr:sulfotransferase [Gaiellaceae bacterium]
MDGPVFVVGSSRSGTNLTRALLNRHSELWVSGETHYFDDLRPRLPGCGKERLEGPARDRCEEYFLALSHRAFGQAGDPAGSRVDAGELRSAATELGGTGDAYFEALCVIRAGLHGRPHWGEKTPRHVYRIDAVLGAFPNAKVVCLVRDPRAVVASYRDWHRAAERRGVVESEQLSADRERTRRSFNVVLMSLLWRAVVRASYTALETHGVERVRIQRFERLAQQPEAEVRDLCAWLGLPFEPALLEIPVVNSSYATQGEGISTEPLDRWRERLPDADVGVVQACCGSLMDELGYERVDAPVGRARLAWAFGTAPFAAARAGVANRARLGRASQYLRRRAGSAFSRGPLGAE